MTPKRELVPREIVECIKQARGPTVPELNKVANHIWSDIRGSEERWRQNLSDSRLVCFRAALAALTGESNPTLWAR